MPSPATIDRLITGYKPIDAWIDKIVSAIEQALNVTGGDGISVRRGPQGTQLALNLGPMSTLAMVKSGGIPKMSGGIPGKGKITIQSFDGEHAPMGTYDDDGYNIGLEDIDEGLVIVTRLGRYWFVVVDPCPSEEA